LLQELHVGKLQLIATSTANNHMKVSWLVWWNSSTPTWATRKLLDELVGEEKLLTWLGKVCWYVGVSLFFVLWIKVQFSFILNLTIFLNYDIFDTLCIFQLINAAVNSFNSIVAKDGIVLNLGGLDGLDIEPAYLENWRIQLWDLAFSIVFKGVCPFKKSGVFVDYCRANLLMKRVIYK
jgi:hypothetical protein